MTGMHCHLKRAEFKAVLDVSGDAVRNLVRRTLQEIREEEVTEALGAEERATLWSCGLFFGYRNWFWRRGSVGLRFAFRVLERRVRHRTV